MREATLPHLSFFIGHLSLRHRLFDRSGSGNDKSPLTIEKGGKGFPFCDFSSAIRHNPSSEIM